MYFDAQSIILKTTKEHCVVLVNYIILVANYISHMSEARKVAANINTIKLTLKRYMKLKENIAVTHKSYEFYFAVNGHQYMSN